jgi:hypothetical protein
MYPCRRTEAAFGARCVRVGVSTCVRVDGPPLWACSGAAVPRHSVRAASVSAQSAQRRAFKRSPFKSL